MARLILDENGKLRAFKLNDGRMTLGTSEGCTLRLVSEEVAEVHAELRVEDGVVTLVPRQGVLPPQLLGQPVKQPIRLAANAEFHIGRALLRIESTDAPVAQGSVKPGVRKTREGTGTTPRSTGVVRKRRKISRGMPAWLVIAILVVGAGAIYFGGRKWWGEPGEIAWNPAARYEDARKAYAQGGVQRAKAELDKIDLERTTPELRAEVLKFRALIASDNEVAVDAEHNMRGTKMLDTQLKKYVDRFLAGDRATRPAARFFIKRCDIFKAEYPTHKDMGWVDRFRTRYAKIAEAESPSTYADVEWEVKRTAASKPRDYATIFKLMKEFSARPDSPTTEIANLQAEQESEREAYFLDRLLQSQYHWKKKEYGKSVEELVQLVLKIGVKEKEDKAIETFLRMADSQGNAIADDYLGSYKKNRPGVFERMMEYPRLNQAAKAADLL